MGRVYRIPISPTAVTAQVDLWEVAPAANKPVIIRGIKVYQTSDFGDAQDEVLGIEIRRGGTAMTTGTGGSQAVTAIPSNPADTGAGFTADTLNTTLATFTAGVLVDADGWNVRQPFIWQPIPEELIYCHNGNGGFVVRLGAAPADSLTIGGTLVVEEGG